MITSCLSVNSMRRLFNPVAFLLHVHLRLPPITSRDAQPTCSTVA